MSPDQPLSIAIVTGSMSRLAGGLFNSVRSSALALNAAGHKVEIFAYADEHSKEDRAAWAPLEPLAAKRKGLTAFGYAPEIGERLMAGDFDIVHQHGIWQGFSMQVSKWRKSTDRPVMISPRGMLDPWALSNSAWKKKLSGVLFERENLHAATAMHALNASEAESMREFGLTNPIATIANGAELPQDRELAAPEWWPDGKVLLFIGRIHPKKGVAELIKAFANFSQTPDAEGWNCVIGGWDDGGHIGNLKAQIAESGMEGRILLPGSLFGEEKEAALRNANAFILPSYSEGLPMSVLEAWAYGLPVLMTPECNLPEGFTKDAAVEITTDPALLSTQLSTALSPSNTGLLAKMGKNGRELVEQRYSWRQIAQSHADVYRWMIDQQDETPSCVDFVGANQP